MSRATVVVWSVFCNTEGCMVPIKQKQRPTVCPNNASHSIDLDKTTYQIDLATPVLQDPTIQRGFYKTFGINFSCPSNATTTYNASWPYEIIIINGYMLTEDENKGDVLNCILTPDLTVGALTQSVTTGDTVINVSGTAIDNLVKGVKVKFGDSNVYTVLFVDIVNSQITIDPSAVTDYSPATLITRNIFVFENLTLPSKSKISLGSLNPYRIVVPPNYVFRLLYTNNTADTKTFNFYLEFY